MNFDNYCCMKLKVACNLWILFSVTINAKTAPTKPCKKIRIGDNWYEKDTFYLNVSKAYNLNVLKSANTLFYSYSVSDTSSDMDFRLGYVNLDKKEPQTIIGIKGGFSIALDQIYDDIYLGGSDGIYKFNMATKIADFYLEKGKNIWSLFFRVNLFYISYPDQKLHIQYDAKFYKVTEFENIEIDHFHVNSNNELFYANKSGFFKFNDQKMLSEVLADRIIVRQIVDDNEGDTYVCTNLGVYLIGGQHGFKKILAVKNIYGLTFDSENNIIYSDGKQIVRLKPNSFACSNNVNNNIV